jgi:hypothetical protein
MICRWMSFLLACFIPSLPAASPDQTVTVRSLGSGQFVVHGPRFGFGTELANAAGPNLGPVSLDPAVLAIGCDRIKQQLLQELASPDRWRGKIHIFINPRQPVNSSIEVQSAFYADGWQGRIDLPARLEADRLIRVVVQALILEIANRAPPNYTAELPLWLTEGLTQFLLNTGGSRLVLEPKTRTIRAEVRSDPLAQVRNRLQAYSSLTFGELSMPGPEHLSQPRWQQYQDSACWLVHQLLQLRQGRQMLADFVSRLAHNLNWQTAFFQSFGDCFERPIDVEKWWLLGIVNGTNRDRWLALMQPVCLEKLQEILQVPVSVRYAPELLPVSSHITLQEFIEQWSLEAQKEVLAGKINQLNLLRLNAPEDLQALITGYQNVLTEYLQLRQNPELQHKTKNYYFLPAPILVPKTVQQLNDLDRQHLVHRQNSAPG